MNNKAAIGFVLREWLLSASVVLCLLTTAWRGQGPAWSMDEAQVLVVLFALFVAVKGVERSGALSWIARRVERGNRLSLKLVLTTFVLSMLVTNDAALVVMVPLTLALRIDHKDMLVILEALAANAGSALTPFGNPQNLFIYWHYGLSPSEFMLAILPFVIFFLLLLGFSAMLFRARPVFSAGALPEACVDISAAFFYVLMLVFVILTVLRVMPVWANIVVVAYVYLFDKGTLRIDYALLLSFFFFFGIADNLSAIFATHMEHPMNVFLISAAASQVISNVPAAVVMAEFTANWKALLWGTSVGGFGSLVGSLANLIAYRFYVNSEETGRSMAFTMKFLLYGYFAFGAGVVLNYMISR